MKRFILSLVAAGALSVSAAQAVTVVSTLTDDVTISGNVTNGANINGDQFTFSWDVSGGDTGLSGLSALIEFSLPGAAQISFDSFGSNADDQQSGFVLYQVGGPSLTSENPTGTAGGGVAGIAGQDRILIGDLASAVQPGTILYDGIGGGDAFVPGGGGTWVVGIFDSGNPSVGSASFTITAVPVPASGLLLLAAGGAFAALRRRRKAA